MAEASRRDIARAALARYPKSYAEELGIDLAQGTPSPLYQWLLASLLFSARIAAGQAQKAAADLFAQGWRTPGRMAETTWEQRVEVLNRAGYARYDESTSRYIGDSTDLLLDRYSGDLRKLREAAQREPERERELLMAFKGIGQVGADIFCREVQVVWDELHPFADGKALKAAGALGLGRNAKDLAGLVDGRRDLPRLLTALVRIELAGEAEAVLQEAA